MKYLVFILLLHLQFSLMSQTKAKLIYVGDPMCSWCYGIAPELSKVMEHYDDKIHYELIMGGLRPYNTQTMIELKDFLTEHWEEVHHRSGQKFNYSILDSKDITYDTEPPSRATIVIRKLAPEKEIAFFKKSQLAFYLENNNMHLAESYQAILNDLNIDFQSFKELFESQEMKEAIKLDFQKAQEMGVRGFPTLILEHEGQLHLLANGYSTSEKIIQRIDKIL